ncbi:MAG: regulatory protein RecX [bacterium]
MPGHDEDELGDPEAVARTLCLRQLDVRARTRAELERYLAGKGVPEEPAGRVLDRFVELGLVDDRALAAAFVEAAHRYQGLARRGLAVKLRRRGVDDAVVAEAVAVIDGEQEANAARALAQRRLRSLSDLDRTVQVRRLVGLLARKGYPSGLAYRVVREVVGAAPPDTEDPALPPDVHSARRTRSAGGDDDPTGPGPVRPGRRRVGLTSP